MRHAEPRQVGITYKQFSSVKAGIFTATDRLSNLQICKSLWPFVCMSSNKQTREKHTPNAKCIICGKPFYRFPYEIRKDITHCCSSICAFELNRERYKILKKPNTTCSLCGKQFYKIPSHRNSKSGKYFCSKKCQNIAYKLHIVVSGKKPLLFNDKIPNTVFGKDRCRAVKKLKMYSDGRKCKKCGIQITNNNKSGYCVKCLKTNSKYTKAEKVAMSKRAKILMRSGKIKPWQSRNKLSYPEKFFKKVLELNGIVFEGPNFVIKQKDIGVHDCLPNSCYFLDFKIGNVDLEIDGKQHEYTDRKLYDKKRDYYLTNAGYCVYRIKWRSINTVEGKEYIRAEIRRLLDFLRSRSLMVKHPAYTRQTPS